MQRALIIGGIVLAGVVAVVLAVTLSGGEPEPEPSPTPSPSPSPSPTPSPTPELEDVDGALNVEQRSVAVSGNRVFVEGSNRDREPEVDQGAVDAFTNGIKSWLDRHFDAVQREEFPPDEATLPFDTEEDTALLAAVSTEMASRDEPIRSTTYDVTVFVSDRPEWASATAVLELDGGRQSTATFVFVPGDPEPVLVAATPGGDR